MNKPTNQELENRFIYHKPGPGDRERHRAITESTLQLAKLVRDLTPMSRQQALALEALEEVRMWANAAIACNPTTNDKEEA